MDVDPLALNTFYGTTDDELSPIIQDVAPADPHDAGKYFYNRVDRILSRLRRISAEVDTRIYASRDVSGFPLTPSART